MLTERGVKGSGPVMMRDNLPQATDMRKTMTTRYGRQTAKHKTKYTGCNRRNGPDFGRVFLMLNYTEKPQNIYIQS